MARKARLSEAIPMRNPCRKRWVSLSVQPALRLRGRRRHNPRMSPAGDATTRFGHKSLGIHWV